MKDEIKLYFSFFIYLYKNSGHRVKGKKKGRKGKFNMFFTLMDMVKYEFVLLSFMVQVHNLCCSKDIIIKHLFIENLLIIQVFIIECNILLSNIMILYLLYFISQYRDFIESTYKKRKKLNTIYKKTIYNNCNNYIIYI